MILVKDNPPFEYDNLLEEAIKICIQYERVSASVLQKCLAIGYARTARLIDQMEFVGILSKPGSFGTPRKIILPRAKGKMLREDSKEFLIANSELIQKTLLIHDIQIKINSVNVNAKNICFFMEVAVGVSLNKLFGLKKELAMALASPTGKIELAAPFKETPMVALYLPTKTNLKKANYRVIHSIL
jgi:DNA segregation ATPase FtsK/SpoIIIE-like protein